MDKINLFRLLPTLIILYICHVAAAPLRNTYIVHMAKSQIPVTFNDHTHWYRSSLKSVSASAQIFYTYNTVLHGFSTRLTSYEAQSLQNQPGVVSVFPEVRYELQTTRSPEFLGLGRNVELFPEFDSVSDVIIGVLDTGVWPETKSFDDSRLGPIPSSWRGECESGTNFNSSNCNRKLIGARSFSKGYEAEMGPINENLESNSPRDDDGHGTHTSTTAAGSSVAGASLLGYASGTVRGMATRARVAMYKVCWVRGCFSSDILAGMEKAIQDNVNVLSLSLSGGLTDYYSNSISIGAFAAMEKGILVSCAAGNSGPTASTLSNVAPWITTVGAGTIDRDFPAHVSLGNGRNFSGVSLYRGETKLNMMLPFVYAGNVNSTSRGNLCMWDSLLPEKVNGKIVLCDRGENDRAAKGAAVMDAGGIGMILTNTEENSDKLIADAHLIPATLVTKRSGNTMKRYISSDPNPTVTILFEGTKIGVQPSPVLAAFSSRGPNTITPEILKPDLIAPGVNILAGWAGSRGPTGLLEDERRVEFNIMSGTSMSCPHVSGLVALLKAAHPEWSPAAIRSALMTTAYTEYKNGKPIEDSATGKRSTPFDHGAGHVDPISAINPGLVYDLTVNDYLNFLCAIDYTDANINILAKNNFSCDPTKKYRAVDLNYPSFAVSLRNGNVKCTRTLTNVGWPSTYKVSLVSKSKSVKVSVQPESLTFTKRNDKKSYTVTFSSGSGPLTERNSFGRIVWSDGKHTVGSPFAVSWT